LDTANGGSIDWQWFLADFVSEGIAGCGHVIYKYFVNFPYVCSALTVVEVQCVS